MGTLGLNILIIQIVKLAVFGSRNFLHPPVLFYGALLVPFMIIGTVLGKQILIRVSESLFVIMVEVVMIVAGLNFIMRGAA